MTDQSPQLFQPNYDESKVPAYTLPDPLVFMDGSKVRSAQDWFTRRREEILNLFEQEMFGISPRRPADLHFKVREDFPHAFDGLATRRQVTITFAPDEQGPHMNLLFYVPNHRHKPAPLLMGLNFMGNHAIHIDPAILMPAHPLEFPGKPSGSVERGASASRWPVEHILERGYALATANYNDIDPDFDDDFQNGVHPLFDQQRSEHPELWGSVAAWAWGLSRALDYFETDPDIDAHRAAVMGHSRLGKAALWAGASDPRFAAVISNDSGCAGAALSRRAFGETVGRINNAFPHWFCQNFKKYGGHEDQLPFDQHELIALVAPRPVYIASAEEDLWADPRGEFLSALHASPVYRMLNTDGLAADEMPAVEQPVLSTISYHIRRGKHDVTLYDWDRYLDFADRYL